MNNEKKWDYKPKLECKMSNVILEKDFDQRHH
jgi:hypothetical protein